MQELQIIDSTLSEQKKKVESLVNTLEFIDCGEFNEETNLDFLDYSGVYLLEIFSEQHQSLDIDSWLSTFKENWDTDIAKDKSTPSTKQKRLKHHTELFEFMPFYLGKSEKISTRLNSHINLKFSQRTYGLKLIERGFFEQYKLRLKVCKIDVINYNIIVPIVEDYLREKFQPIVGNK